MKSKDLAVGDRFQDVSHLASESWDPYDGRTLLFGARGPNTTRLIGKLNSTEFTPTVEFRSGLKGYGKSHDI